MLYIKYTQNSNLKDIERWFEKVVLRKILNIDWYIEYHKLIKKIKTYVREEVGIGKYYYKNIITNIWNTYKLATNLIQNTSRILCVFIVYLTKQDNRHNKWTWSMYK